MNIQTLVASGWLAAITVVALGMVHEYHVSSEFSPVIPGIILAILILSGVIMQLAMMHLNPDGDEKKEEKK